MSLDVPGRTSTSPVRPVRVTDGCSMCSVIGNAVATSWFYSDGGNFEKQGFLFLLITAFALLIESVGTTRGQVHGFFTQLSARLDATLSYSKCINPSHMNNVSKQTTKGRVSSHLSPLF